MNFTVLRRDFTSLKLFNIQLEYEITLNEGSVSGDSLNELLLINTNGKLEPEPFRVNPYLSSHEERCENIVS